MEARFACSRGNSDELCAQASFAAICSEIINFLDNYLYRKLEDGSLIENTGYVCRREYEGLRSGCSDFFYTLDRKYPHFIDIHRPFAIHVFNLLHGYELQMRKSPEYKKFALPTVACFDDELKT